MKCYVITPVRIAVTAWRLPTWYALRGMWQVLRLGFWPTSVAILWPFVSNDRAMRLAKDMVQAADLVAVDPSLGWGRGMEQEWEWAREKPRIFLV